MANTILITGRPGVGKTKLIRRLLHDLTPLIIRGFYKEEIQEFGVRRGFRIVSPNYEDLIFAHIHLEGPDRYQEFGINLEGFEKFISHEFDPGLMTEMYVIDELGPMEHLSPAFIDRVKELAANKIPMVATVSSVHMPEWKALMKQKNVKVLQMNESNRDDMWKLVLTHLG
jgi:nucleoside-triphosphatase